MNDDENIDIMDVIRLNRYLLGSFVLDDADKRCADVDHNGDVDSTDSLTILKYVVELISAFE